MRNALKTAVLLSAMAWAVQAEDVKAKSRVVSLGLFKNGLSVVKRAVSIPGPGTCLVEDVPEPVHGTFWVESSAEVEVRVTSRVVETPVHRRVGVDFQEELVGSDVVIFFRDGQIPPASGKVVQVEQTRGEEAWNRTYERPDYYGGYSGRGAQSPPPGRFLVLDGPDGRTYVDSGMIAYLRSKGGQGTVKRRMPVLLLTAKETGGKPVEVAISYLAKGAAWAPSYRVDISDPKTLTIQQNAVVKNELEDVEDAEISLISGFPSIQFGHVTSPLSMRTNWTSFFQQLNQRPGPSHAMASNFMGQQVAAYREPASAAGLDLSATPSGEGVDLHYQPIGKRALAEGDSLALNIASGKAAYDRIVEWTIPDTRQANGHYIQEYQRQQEPEKYDDAAWDAVRFKNPLPFPMTTGPAMITANGQFNGQRLSFWVNTGEETTLHVTKALSIRTRHVEHEEQPGTREIVYVGGNDFRKATVKGELTVNNHRKETVSLVIRRRFSGDLLAADGSPKCVLLEEGVYSVNKRNELIWSLPLEPGKEQTLTYRYSVLVDN